MTKVVADITMSLDGYVTGPDPDLDHGLGHDGEPLHDWVMKGNETDAAILREATEETGAVVMGRRLFDIIDGPKGWSDDMGYGAEHASAPPFFVVTHAAPESMRLTLDFTFVTDGVGSAIDQARAAAGDKDVVVMGGGDVIGQCLEQGLVEQLRIHLAPLILGAGTPLFANVGRREFVQREVRVSDAATHLVYDLRG